MPNKSEDLVFLSFAMNCCYTTLSEECPKEVTVNLDDGSWTYTREPDRTYRIGEGCRIGGRTYGIIGVYDRRNVGHLSSMISNAREATSDHNNDLY